VRKNLLHVYSSEGSQEGSHNYKFLLRQTINSINSILMDDPA
jgi:hypothetical protein